MLPIGQAGLDALVAAAEGEDKSRPPATSAEAATAAAAATDSGLSTDDTHGGTGEADTAAPQQQAAQQAGQRLRRDPRDPVNGVLRAATEHAAAAAAAHPVSFDGASAGTANRAPTAAAVGAAGRPGQQRTGQPSVADGATGQVAGAGTATQPAGGMLRLCGLPGFLAFWARGLPAQLHGPVANCCRPSS